jgi:ABC-type polysaccharide/polyol phosphate transport system ATPase subunit
MSYAIEVENLWKRFPLSKDRPGFKEFILTLHNRRNRYSNFWALRGVNLNIKEGECLGVVGKNGSGKSTLLSLILGGIYPTRGKITVSKRITPLLELGAGFHPDLTGRENILLNGVILGLMSEEVVERMDDIISFSEINDFIDMPVRTYSTGMYLRIAFAVAIHTNPELLLIDEILAVGDESFHKKSRAALLRLIKGGVTTLLVSHDLEAIKEICSRGIWLDHGEIRSEGEPGKVVEEYLRHSP